MLTIGELRISTLFKDRQYKAQVATRQLKCG